MTGSDSQYRQALCGRVRLTVQTGSPWQGQTHSTDRISVTGSDSQYKQGLRGRVRLTVQIGSQ